MDAAWVAKKTEQARATARERNERLLEFARGEREILLRTPEEDRMPWADGGGYDVLCNLLPRAIDETISPDDIETLLLAFMRVNLENDIEEVVSEEGICRTPSSTSRAGTTSSPTPATSACATASRPAFPSSTPGTPCTATGAARCTRFP